LAPPPGLAELAFLTAVCTAGAKDCAVFDAVFMPKYAVVMVPIAVKALVRIAIIGELLFVEPAVFQTPITAAAAMATSPATTTHKPVQARVRCTVLSDGLSFLVGAGSACAALPADDPELSAIYLLGRIRHSGFAEMDDLPNDNGTTAIC